MSEPTHPDSAAPEDSQNGPSATEHDQGSEASDHLQESSDEAPENPDSPECIQPTESEEQDEPDDAGPSVPSPESVPSAASASSAESPDDAENEEGASAVEAQEQDDGASPEPSEASPSDINGAAPQDQASPQDGTGQQDRPEHMPLAEPHTRTGVAPIISVPSGPDKGLGGFFDTLDERAKEWWATYRIRQARRKVLAARAAREQPAGSAPEDASNAVPTSPSGHRARHGGGGPRLRATPEETSRVGLPKPPPAEHRPADQLFTSAIPVVPVAQAGATVSDGQSPAAAEVLGNDDQTTVLPAYQGDGPARPASPVNRRELDEQRRRTVIAQKASAIEKATSEPAPAPYGGSGYIGASDQQHNYEPADDEDDLYTYIPPYNLPSRDADPEPTQWDVARRVFVSLGALAAVVSTVWMFGWFSFSEDNPAILTRNGLQETYADGWFSGELALLSPDHNWYWIWPAITLALIIHALYQWTSSQQSTPRQQRSGWLVGTASCLMLVLTAALHLGQFTLVLLSSAAIAAALTQAIRQFNLYTARSDTERQLTDDIVGLFFGFAVVQAMSTFSVWLTQRGWDVPGVPAALWAIVGLLLCTWVAAFYSMTERGRITIALGLAWGLFWLVFPRILGEATSVWVALGAALGAFIVILCTQSRRYRINHAERRAAMGRPLEDII